MGDTVPDKKKRMSVAVLENLVVTGTHTESLVLVTITYENSINLKFKPTVSILLVWETSKGLLPKKFPMWFHSL
jgi:hypothetical protein